MSGFYWGRANAWAAFTMSKVNRTLPECYLYPRYMDVAGSLTEQLAALKPDVLFVSNMTLYDQTNPYQQLMDMGVCVLCVPTADSIAAIQEDIAFIAAAMGKSADRGHAGRAGPHRRHRRHRDRQEERLL